jgi:hypothetical protein
MKHLIRITLFVVLAFASSTTPIWGRSVALPNASFESPVTEVGPAIDFWQKSPQPETFDTNIFGAWNNLAGVFFNPPAPDENHIDNTDGNQLAYVFSYPGIALFQDYSSVSQPGGIPSHAFNAKFQAGRSYRLLAALTSSKVQPLREGSTLQLSFYYRDAASNIVRIASTNVTYSTNVFTNITHLLDFSVAVPNVQPADAWAGKNIGVEILSTSSPEFISGVWDVDNVRLTEEIAVPNFSFESPATEVGPAIDAWQKALQPPGFNTNVFGAWANLAGQFFNPPAPDENHIENAQGNQLGYLFAYPQTRLFQDDNAANGTNVLNATFEPGKSYRLMLALTSSKVQPLQQGSTLLLSLYYKDASGNNVTVASTNVTYDTNVFASITRLLDFNVDVPNVQSTDAWAGRNIGIAIESTVLPSLIGGVWDLDNVRLSESTPTALSNPTVKNGQVTFVIQSEPGLKLEVLGSNEIAAPTGSWTSLGTINNFTGTYLFNEIGQNSAHRFYRVRQIE